MLVIRREQMEAFRVAAMQTFASEMVAHLAEFSPPVFRAAGEAQVRQMIGLGVERAASYGLRFRGPVRLYLELMMLFGCQFDSDPQYPWAREILAGHDEESQMECARELYAKVLDYRAQVAGPGEAYAVAALNRVILACRQPFPLPELDLVPALLRLIEYLYPQKAAYVGAAGLEELIRKAITGARRQQFLTARGAALVSGLMLTFGHGCGADPLYPWIKTILQDQGLVDAPARAKRLEAEALAWLEALQADLAKGV